MKILGIETSCDETGAAVIEYNPDVRRLTVLSNIIATSLALHAETGGIIPEMAAREQVKFILPVIDQALLESNSQRLKMKDQTPDIDAIAVTYGPGLIGSLLVGVETAKTLSYVWNKPLIPINHLFGHIYANWLTQKSDEQKNSKTIVTPKREDFPAIALLVSGGHTDLVYMKDAKTLEWIGGTRDDAAGECFDKCARLLGYPYPGGPKIAELAKKGNVKAFDFPRPMLDSKDFEFSFSGLKTAFLNATKEHFPILRTSEEKIGWQQIVLEEQVNVSEKQLLHDLCASLQQAIIETLVKKTMKAVETYNVKSLLLSGGVAANENLTQLFKIHCNELGISFFVPIKKFCTDNGAMIAAAGAIQYNPVDWSTVTADPELYFD